MRRSASDEPPVHRDEVLRPGPSLAAWFGAGCWVVFLLLGSLYFIYGSDLFGYVVGVFCIGSAIYGIRRELRWVSTSREQLVIRGLLHRREYALNDGVTWATSPVSSGLPLHRTEVMSQGQSLIRLESQRYGSEAKAAAVAERLFSYATRWSRAGSRLTATPGRVHRTSVVTHEQSTRADAGCCFCM